VGSPDPAGGAELPDLGDADRPPADPGAGAGQGRRRAGERPLEGRALGDSRLAKAIATAAEDVAAGEWDDQFPVDVFQTGSGTSSNMNMNEVLAHLGDEELGEDGAVHPNDHVNASQSSNDVFPTAIHVAVTEAIQNEVIPAFENLSSSLRRKQGQFRNVVKAGRTHLMDATPVTLGQEFGGYAAQIEECIERLWDSLPRVGRLPLGGTAVGTGINAPRPSAVR
jgi:fumarate hydratase, class II